MGDLVAIDRHVTPPADPTPAEAIRALGFDPDRVRAVVLTPTSVVAIAADYPEPYIRPEA
jgi:hypothetical protein